MRGLPGHNECPLIKSPSEGQSFHVLLTDIGNDLVYGANVPQIAAWVREIAEKLTDLGAEVLMTELPLTSVRNLTKARFLTFRTVFFPASGLQYPAVLDLAEKLNEHVQSICEDVGGTLIQPLPEWYGLDPIHIRKRHRAAAWAHIFQKFSGWSGTPDSAISVTDRCRLRFTRPVHDKWFGRESTNVGICHLSDGTKVQFF